MDGAAPNMLAAAAPWIVEHQSHGVHRLRGGKFILDPCLLPCRGLR